MLEVETYRRQADAVVGRTIVGVDAPDAWYVKNVDPAELVAALTRPHASRQPGASASCWSSTSTTAAGWGCGSG